MTDQNNAETSGDTGEQERNEQAQDQTGSVSDNSGNEHMIPRSRLNKEIDKRKSAEKALDEIAESLIEALPEKFKDIIPELHPAEKIKWIQSAQKQGFFEEPKTVNGPDSKRPGDQKPEDFSNMSPQAIMAGGYKTK